MDIVIAGGHGKIARRLTPLLVARGDRVRGLTRNPDHAVDLRDDGSSVIGGDEPIAPALAAVLGDHR